MTWRDAGSDHERVAMTRNRALPIHPRFGTALGWTSRGPIWPIAGGSTESDPPPDPPVDPPDPPAPDDKALGEKGEKALASEREARKVAERELAKYKKAEADRELAGKSELEQASAKQAAAEKKAAEALSRAVRAEVKAAATAWADPSDASLYLGDLTQYVGEDGAIDDAAITKALDAVLKDKPHLARATGPVVPRPDPGQGHGNDTPTRSTSLGAAVSKALTKG